MWFRSILKNQFKIRSNPSDFIKRHPIHLIIFICMRLLVFLNWFAILI